ncbi:unnamed protein product [Allacma fusca]|uniref:Uncharacterized protein n=1 Tax=Allacma fusca TaxID=39272 RepID=A0A8J2JPS8_9HEXA|nr:unnamed protein product [Allacma fusca]
MKRRRKEEQVPHVPWGVPSSSSLIQEALSRNFSDEMTMEQKPGLYSSQQIKNGRGASPKENTRLYRTSSLYCLYGSVMAHKGPS